jgi:3',5'-nucleoside bisphosphate phosphatase
MPTGLFPVDLHTHSTASDGTATPAQLIRLARRYKIAVALCDHDTLDGQTEALNAAKCLGVTYTPAIEISCHLRLEKEPEREIHILGYFIEIASPALVDYTIRRKRQRDERVRNICGLLAGIGIQLDCAALINGRFGAQIGRPHVARALVEAGFVRDIAEAFDKYLGKTKPAYVPYEKLIYAADAIRLIKQAGGAAIIAHPGEYGLYVIDPALGQLIEAGLDGIEIVHPRNDHAVAAHYAKIAGKYALAMTGGSDWHGGNSRHEAPMGTYGMSCAALEHLKKRSGFSA